MPEHRHGHVRQHQRIRAEVPREEKPNLVSAARVANRASGLRGSRIRSRRMEAEYAATIQIAKKHGLMELTPDLTLRGSGDTASAAAPNF
jgi:hypothetical protein